MSSPLLEMGYWKTPSAARSLGTDDSLITPPDHRTGIVACFLGGSNGDDYPCGIKPSDQ
jgi:hypothetical protein